MKATEHSDSCPFAPLIPQLIDHGRFTMNPKLWLKIFPVVLLTIVPIVGTGGVARSQVITQQSENQNQEIDRLIQELKSGDVETRSSAAFALGHMGESAIPRLLSLLKDADRNVRSSTTNPLKNTGKLVPVMPLRTIAQSPAQPSQTPSRSLPAAQLVDDVWQQVNRNYIDPKFNGQNWNTVRQRYVSRSYNSYNEAYQAIHEMLKLLGDPLTRFYDPVAFKALQAAGDGPVGIGLRMVNQGENRELTVVESIEDSPSQKVGILRGDILTKIDGVSVQAKDVSDAAWLLRGKAGTVVSLELLRQGQSIPLKIQRARIPLRSVRHRVEDTPIGRIGYIRCNEFIVNSEVDMKAAIAALEKQDVKGYVLDLRGNPGGLLSNGIKIARMWLDRGPIMSTITRDGSVESEQANNQALTQKPLVVMVDGNSSSASEIIAASVQENERASLVGTKTSGNTSIQSIKQLQNETALAVTIGKWLTPSGRDVSRTGLTPDVVVELAEQQRRELLSDFNKIGTMADPQFAKAVETLSQKVQSFR
jgi:carboxyl-terminal processing protease